MKVKKINHISLHNEWYDNEIYSKAETLVLGSFNPYNNDETKNADYYYGRSSNHFWKSVSRNNKLNEDYFCNNLDDFQKYQRDFAPALQKDHMDRYKDKYVAFRTLMEEL